MGDGTGVGDGDYWKYFPKYYAHFPIISIYAFINKINFSCHQFNKKTVNHILPNFSKRKVIYTHLFSNFH
jgi:hypothetical protein